MFRTITKAKTSSSAQRGIDLQNRAEQFLRRAFRRFIDEAKELEIEPFIEDGDLSSLLSVLDIPITRFASHWTSIFTDIGQREADALELTTKARKPTVRGIFDPGDSAAAEFMNRARLALITNLSREQRNIVRETLASGLQRGLGTRAMAREVKDVLGLSEQGFKNVQRYRQILERGDAVAAQNRQLRDRNFDQVLDRLKDPDDALDELSPSRIDRMVRRYAENWKQHRAEAVARTESLRVTSTARDYALRQSARAVGQDLNLTGKRWVAVNDSRTRDHHRQAHNQRQRMDDPFEVDGELIQKPGDGSPRNSINCRCAVEYHFFDTEDAFQDWLASGS